MSEFRNVRVTADCPDCNGIGWIERAGGYGGTARCLADGCREGRVPIPVEQITVGRFAGEPLDSWDVFSSEEMEEPDRFGLEFASAYVVLPFTGDET